MVETVIGGCAGGFESRNGVSKLVQMEKTWVALRFKMVVLLLWVQLKLLQAMEFVIMEQYEVLEQIGQGLLVLHFL
ncbi:hypothetical protein C5167_004188 [Papaver somniferum]|nr:hypothetical protein C5167_004188 [Papaver somniferum]